MTMLYILRYWIPQDLHYLKFPHGIWCQKNIELDAGMWRYHANRMDARRSQFDLERVDAYI